MTNEPWPEAARTAAEGRARLVAILAKSTRDVAAAEDALQAAFVSALETWPQRGVPISPDAWLITTAKRKLLDIHRRRKTGDASTDHLSMMIDELASLEAEECALPDRRLELLFVCAHPAIDEALHPMLMLNVVLGIAAEDIATCWLVKPSAMSQRLVRAKAKIKTAGIAFELPSPIERASRIDAVLTAIYAALTIGRGNRGLIEEAGWLSAVVHKLAPEHAEAAGLLALCLQIGATYSADSQRFTPLSHRDPSGWDKRAINLAEITLTKAARLQKPGRYQLEAAIQSAHIANALDGIDTTEAVLSLYKALLTHAPSVGAHCSYAAALVNANRREDAENILDKVAPQAKAYQPFWVVLSETAKAAGDIDGAKQALREAIRLSNDPAIIQFLKAKLRALSDD